MVEEMGEKKKDMPTVWFSLKKSLHCQSEPSDVHKPTARKQRVAILTKKAAGKSGCSCSRSIANLKDVLHGSKRHLERPPSCSPRSIGSSEFVNPIAHEVILSNSSCDLKITGFGTLTPGTPGPGSQPTMHYFNPSFKSSSATPPRMKTASFLTDKDGFMNGDGFPSRKKGGCNALTCHRCGEQFVEWETLESHHLSNHAVSELVEGESSRRIVEIICRSSWLKAENPSCVRIDRVVKVHNTQKTLVRFEEYREAVKLKAGKLPKKHPRCLADGNELLRFFGTTMACSLGLNGSSALCTSDKCCVCQIIRQGFSEVKGGGIGVFTTSTSVKAFECIETDDRKALIVCRVIAGRVHRPLENMGDMAGQTGFDSLAGKVGLYNNIEELYLLSPRALLPCFVVVCKC